MILLASFGDALAEGIKHGFSVLIFLFIIFILVPILILKTGKKGKRK
jgi:cbb3-type cytochrome oxidase subunit 3